MRIDELKEEHGVPEEVVGVLEEKGIKELYEPQAEAIKRGVLDGKNFVLSIPTAAGKTLIAELAMLKSIFSEGGNCLYIVPLRALASEKYEDFKEKYEQLGIDVGIATGDYDISDSRLSKHDILIATSEKVDSLLRHKAKWLADSTTVAVLDEVHLIDEPERGPTLEVLAARLRQINPQLQILGLSATIRNSGEIAEWLNAVHLKSDWRPVPLKEGVYFRGKIIFGDLSEQGVETSGPSKVSKIAADVLERDDGQVLVFVSTRRSTQAAARKASKKIRDYLSDWERRELDSAAQEIKNALGESTDTCRKLAKYVKRGVAFHHAGLHHRQRSTIEDAFRKNLIKVICATPTLAAGVSLPSRRTIIRDYKRYSPPFGMKPIPVLEYKQMAGRAGRPEHDDYGESVLISDSEVEKEQLLENYIWAEPERIVSKLSSEPALRTHVLGSVAAGYVNSMDSMMDFIDRTFFAYQRSTHEVSGTVEEVLDFLKEEGLVSDEGRWLSATKFGKRVSQLYIDPLTGVELRDGLEKGREKQVSELGVLHLVCSVPDMDTLYLRKGENSEYGILASDYNDANKLLIEPPDEWRNPERYEYYLAEVKTAKMLQDWISEEKEEKIHEKYGVGAGDIRRKVSSAEWLLNAAFELSKLFGAKSCGKLLKDLRERVRYGIREELLGLASLRGVGRVRARRLYEAGFESLGDLREAGVEDLAGIRNIGKETAKSILSQVQEGY
ncbi:MAG: ATP-dependent DNA helicase [Candidatus Hadarchaeota archaeon]